MPQIQTTTSTATTQSHTFPDTGFGGPGSGVVGPQIGDRVNSHPPTTTSRNEWTVFQLRGLLGGSHVSLEQLLQASENLRRMSLTQLVGNPEHLDQLVQQMVHHGLLATGEERPFKQTTILATIADLLDPRTTGGDVVRALSPQTKALVEQLVGAFDAEQSLPELMEDAASESRVPLQRARLLLQHIPGFEMSQPSQSFQDIFSRLVPLAEGARAFMVSHGETAPAVGSMEHPPLGGASTEGSLVDLSIRMVAQFETTRERLMDGLRQGEDLSQESLMLLEAELKNISSMIAAFQAILEDEHEQRRRAAESIA